ncbi:DUF2577 domain-containing protein [Neobacillus mesonae]|nr:DUF2577 domain-containing protein [Neobacillus mesonae]
MRHVIKKLGHNRDTDVEYATVTAAPPSLRIKLDNMPFELEPGDYVICSHLTKRTETIKLNGTDADIEYPDVLKAGDRVVVLSANNGQSYVILDRIGGGADGA